MAIKSTETDQNLTLVIDNGERNKLNEVMEKWSFKDYKSLLQFAISILVLNEDRSISIKRDGIQQAYAPAPELLK